MAKTRLYFVTDVHGSDRCFRKFLNSAKFYGAGVLILGGDITGKAIVPIIKRADGTYDTRFIGTDMKIKSEEELVQMKKQIGDAGSYPYVTDQNGFERLEGSEPERDRLFTELIVERIHQWMKLAEERLSGTSIKCYISPGNDDIFEIDAALNSSPVVLNPEEKVVLIDDEHEMITLGYTNHTPWHSPREVDEEVLAQKIASMTSQVKDMKKAIFNLHVPPIETPIDQAPAVSEELKYVTKGGQVVMISAGSTAVRKSIETNGPMLGVHGHIHESRGIVNIGRTLCANPGSEYGEGILRGFLADIEGDKVKSYLLTSG